jgi:hypothetical protein
MTRHIALIAGKIIIRTRRFAIQTAGSADIMQIA